jgi:ribbon-helix-helix CopG family protein
MPATDTAPETRQRAYRRRINAIGDQEVMIRLSNETVDLLDQLKKRYGLRNRGQALEQLIEKGRVAAQHQ